MTLLSLPNEPTLRLHCAAKELCAQITFSLEDINLEATQVKKLPKDSDDMPDSNIKHNNFEKIIGCPFIALTPATASPEKILRN